MKQSAHSWSAALALTLALVLGTLACEGSIGFQTIRGSGTISEQSYEVSHVTGVELATLGTLHVQFGETEQLRVEAEENLLEYIEVEVEEGLLEIRDRENVNLLPTEGIYYYLTLKELDTVRISGLGNVQLPDLEATEFLVEISGGGNIDVDNLKSDQITVVISGLGDLSIADGEVESQDIAISGGGNYKARGLESNRADVTLSGLGSATLRVQDELDVTITGGGSVEYLGSPIVRQSISGVGHVKKIGD